MIKGPWQFKASHQKLQLECTGKQCELIPYELAVSKQINLFHHNKFYAMYRFNASDFVYLLPSNKDAVEIQISLIKQKDSKEVSNG